VLTGASSSGLSSNTLSQLNSAFGKLIADLGGTQAGSSGTSAAAAAAASSSSTASGSSAAGASAATSSTAALQSFLSNFLQDLQGQNSSTSTLGGTVNTAA